MTEERQTDRICRLASAVLRLPITAVNLVRADDTETLAAFGMPRGPLDHERAFCGETVRRDAAFTIPDTLADAVFRDSPAVTGPPFVRFYTGVPLHGANGQPIGTLCCMDTVPHPDGLAPAERALLADFAILAAEALRREAEAERLAERHARLTEHTRAIVEAIPLPVLTIDATGIVTAWNPAAERVLGWTAAEAVGRFMPHVPPEFVEASRAMQGPVARGQRMIGVEVERMRRDGTRLPVALSSAPLRDADGAPDGAVVILEDITDRRRAAAAAAAHAARVERQAALLARIATAMPAAGDDLAGAMRQIAAAATEVLPGFDAGIWLLETAPERLSLVEVVGRDGAPLPPDHPKRQALLRLPMTGEYAAALRTERDIAVEDAATDPRLAAYHDSIIAPYRIDTILSAPVRVGTELLGLVAACGRSGQRRYSPEERAFIASLADLAAVALEARRRAAAMQRLAEEKERAEAASRAKSLFLGNLSHELRTPLNAIIGFAELLQHANLPASQQREFAEHVAVAGRHLLGVFNGMLEQARVDSGTLTLMEERVKLADLLRDAAAMLQGDALLRRVTVSLEPAPVPDLLADPGRLRQALVNILGNAVKFSPEGGTVRLGLGFDAAAGFRISVQDAGPGIDPADLPRALEPFRQLDEGLRRRTGGAGLGLPLAKAFVEAHGGDLAFAHAPGGGTLVTLTLPWNRALPTEPPPLH